MVMVGPFKATLRTSLPLRSTTTSATSRTLQPTFAMPRLRPREQPNTTAAVPVSRIPPESPRGARHVRQQVLPEVGARGQAALAGARVLVVGCGGLGAPVVHAL